MNIYIYSGCCLYDYMSPSHIHTTVKLNMQNQNDNDT